MININTYFKFILFISLNFLVFSNLSAQIIPTSIPDCVLWLKSDSSITLDVNNNVEQWDDLSPSNIIATQATSSQRPGIITSDLYDYPALTFDGSNDRLEFNTVLSLNQITAFFILNPYSRTINGVFGGPSNPYFFCFGGFNNDMRLNGDGAFGNTKISMSPNNVLTNLYSILNLRTIGNTFQVSVNGEPNSNTGNYNTGPTLINKIGRRAVDGPFLGEMLEIIIFDRELTSGEIDNITTYLADRYGKNIDLGADFSIPYQLCPDTTFSIDTNDFVEVIWNNTDTSFQYQVSEYGQTTVIAKDKLNRITYDTIEISPAIDLNLGSDTTLCLNDSLELVTFFGNGYDILWNTASTDSFIRVGSAGNFWVHISDTIGCSVSDTIEVDIDTFSTVKTLINDTSLCEGSSVFFNYPATITDILWSNSSDSNSIVVNNSGSYWVEATNQNNCINRDTVNITIKGITPNIDFIADSACLGTASIFQDISSTLAPDNISSWLWIFNNSDTSIVQNPSYSFNASGNFPVYLSIETDSGCTNNITKNALVRAQPNANFNSAVICKNTFGNLQDVSSIAQPDSIESWNWSIGGTASFTGQNPNLLFSNEGFNNVTLSVTASNGCSDTISKNIEIFPELIADFSFSNICLGDTVAFEDITSSFSVISREWDFDFFNQTSIATSPNFYYPNAGTYNVSLSITNAIGCMSDTSKLVEIKNLPEAIGSFEDNCLGNVTNFYDNSNVVGGFVEESVWNIENEVLLGDSVNFTFDAEDLYTVYHKITDNFGCTNDTTFSLNIYPLPQVDFDFTPNYGTAPLPVAFNNLSTGGLNYLWRFGENNSTSFDENPNYTYTNNGTYDVQLIVENQFNCIDSLVRTIPIIPTELDVELSNLVVVKTTLLDGSQAFKARVQLNNVGSRLIENIDLKASINQETKVLETWNGVLTIGQSVVYELATSFLVSDEKLLDYLCVEAFNVNDNTELNFNNNKVCKLQQGTIRYSDLYPNPSQDIAFMDIVTARKGSADLRLFDIVGKEVLSLGIIELEEGFNQLQFNCANLQAGKYIVKFIFQDEVFSQTLIISNP